jgi:arginase
MTVIAVPYHLDEYLPDLDLPLMPAEVVTAELPPGGPWERLAVLYDAVARAVAADAGRGGRPVVLTGDCAISLGVVAGLQRAGADPGIVWFDAHGDVQTPETTASGYLGGMPLRLLTGYRPELIAARLGLRPVPEHRIVLAGARDLDPPEETYLASAAIRRYEVAGLTTAGLTRADVTTGDLTTVGLTTVGLTTGGLTTGGLTTGGLPAGPLYVHADLDVIDAAALPGLRYPVPGGPDAARLADALRLLLATGQVAALGIACTWHPGHAAASHVAAQLTNLLALPPGRWQPGRPPCWRYLPGGGRPADRRAGVSYQAVTAQLTALLALPPRTRPRRCVPGAARWRRAGRWPLARTAPDPAAAPRPGRTPRPRR